LSNNQGGWTNWFPLFIANKRGAGGSFVQNGYQQLPGGLILQWGYAPPGSPTNFNGGFTNITFPLTFPTACLNIVNSVSAYGTSNYPSNNFSTIVSFNTSGATIGFDQNGAYWQALGY
jgi:hypothetical protein